KGGVVRMCLRRQKRQHGCRQKPVAGKSAHLRTQSGKLISDHFSPLSFVAYCQCQRGCLLIGIRVVDEAAHAMAALIIAILIDIGFALPVELRGVVDLFVGVVDQAAYSVAAIVAAAGDVVGSGVLPVVLVVVRHALNDGAKHRASCDRSNIVPMMVIHARIGIKRVAAAMMVAADIGKYARTALRNPDIFALWIISPSAVENAGAAGNLVYELRLRQRSCPAFAILIMARLAFDSRLRLRCRGFQKRESEKRGGKPEGSFHRFAPVIMRLTC